MTDLALITIFALLALLCAFSLFMWTREYNLRLEAEKQLKTTAKLNESLIERLYGDAILSEEFLEKR